MLSSGGGGWLSTLLLIIITIFTLRMTAFVPRLCSPEHPLLSPGFYCQGKSGFSSRACRCLFDCILLMNKLFATIGNCFCSLITQVFVVKISFSGHITSARGLVSPCCHPECHQTGTFIEKERDWNSSSCSIFHTMWALIDGRGSSQMAWEMTSLDPWDVMLFAQWIYRSCVGLSWRLMSYWWWSVKRKLGPLGHNNNGATTATMGADWRKISTKEEYSVAKKLFCCGLLCHKQGYYFGFLCS